jgi:hypothetical protein
LEDWHLQNYVQLVRRNDQYESLEIPVSDLPRVDYLLKENNWNKVVFPTREFRRLIDVARDSNIRISAIEFYQDISEDLRDEVNGAIELKDFKGLDDIIDKNRLEVRYLEFLDERQNTIRLFSNGILWLLRRERVSVIEKILSERGLHGRLFEK